MIPRRPSRPLGVGVQLPEVEREVRWPELRAIARTAEQAGFDSIWFGDHLLYRYESGETRGPWEAWTTLAGLAEATERVAIGPLVAATAFHHPFMLAKQAATVDEISGGRLVLGLGAGWNPVEFAALGAPFDHRISRFEEAFTIVRTLLRDGYIDFEGEFFTARDAELLPRPARPGGPGDPRRLQRPAHARGDAPVRTRVERVVRGHAQLARGGAPAPGRGGPRRSRRRPRSRRPSSGPWRSRTGCPVARAGSWATRTRG